MDSDRVVNEDVGDAGDGRDDRDNGVGGGVGGAMITILTLFRDHPLGRIEGNQKNISFDFKGIDSQVCR